MAFDFKVAFCSFPFGSCPTWHPAYLIFHIPNPGWPFISAPNSRHSEQWLDQLTFSQLHDGKKKRMRSPVARRALRFSVGMRQANSLYPPLKLLFSDISCNTIKSNKQVGIHRGSRTWRYNQKHGELLWVVLQLCETDSSYSQGSMLPPPPLEQTECQTQL